MGESTHYRSLPIEPASYNVEKRTIEVIFASDAPVMRRNRDGTTYREILSHAPGAVDLSRLNAGAPFLSSHRGDRLENMLGSVVPGSARTDGKRGTATIKLSSRPDVAGLVSDIASGVIRNISIGYSVETFDRKPSPDGGPPTWTATRWTPFEISAVPIPADPHAQIRGHHMTDETQHEDDAEDETRVLRKRERDENEMRRIAETAHLPDVFLQRHIVKGGTLDEFRTAVLDELVEQQSKVGPQGTTSIGIDHGGPSQSFVRAAGEALYARHRPGHEPSHAARRYIGATTLDLAREALHQRGERALGLSPGDTFQRAMTTSDFPLVLGDMVGRTLRQAYSDAPSGLRAVARQTTARDFRAKHRIQLSAAPQLEKVDEHGEYTYGGLAEARETYNLASYGKILAITRQAIVNDDLGAFNDMAARMGRAAVATENQLLADLLASNPTMSDGVALFHASHGNSASVAASIDVLSLSAARLALRKQTGLAGELISVTPRYLLVGPDRETEAEKALASINPNVVGEVNPFQGKLQIVVDPRIGSEWYVVASPDEVDGLEFCYLEGEPGPRVETRKGFNVDAVEVKIGLDFGAGFVDWRGWYRVP